MKKILMALVFFILSHGILYAQVTGVRSKITSRVKSTKVQPVLDDHTSTLYQCDLGDKLTVYKNDMDDTYINLRWKSRIYRLERQETTTGAERYENKKTGLVLVSIPTKSMLFDSKKGRQLANECKNREQLALNE